MIEIRHITHSYQQSGSGIDSLPLLEDLSLSVQAGEWVSVHGPSGCGKSTLLKLVAGIEKPRSGSITVDGIIPGPALWKTGKVGFVFQDDGLLDHLDARENLTVPLRHGPQRVSRTEADQRVDEILRKLSVPLRSGIPVVSLSGGERQRLALARVMVTRPSVILLDEPLNHLDAIGREKVLTLLSDLRAGRKVTVLHVTHDMDEASLLGDRIAVIRHRKVVRVGAPEQLWTDPGSAELAATLGFPAYNVIPRPTFIPDGIQAEPSDALSGSEAMLVFHPMLVTHVRRQDPPEPSLDDWDFRLRVIRMESWWGSRGYLGILLDDPGEYRLRVFSAGLDGPLVQPGEIIHCRIPVRHLRILPPDAPAD